jgi:Helix-turn-helix
MPGLRAIGLTGLYLWTVIPLVARSAVLAPRIPDRLSANRKLFWRAVAAEVPTDTWSVPRFEAAAERCGLHRTYYSGIESEVRNVSLVNIEKIAKGLKKSLPELFSRA